MLVVKRHAETTSIAINMTLPSLHELQHKSRGGLEAQGNSLEMPPLGMKCRHADKSE